MVGANIAVNTLIKTSMSRLKRGKTYLFDVMNLLYIMCYISVISDFLQQIVSACISFVFFGVFDSFVCLTHRFYLCCTGVYIPGPLV